MSAAFEALLEYALWMSGGRLQVYGLVRRVVGREPEAPFERLFRCLHEALEQEPGWSDEAARLVALETVLGAKVEAPVGLDHPAIGGDRLRLHVLQWTMKRTCLMWMLLALPMRARAVWVLMTRIGADFERTAELLRLHEREAEDALVQAWEQLEGRLQESCEHLGPDNPCRCTARLGAALEAGLVREVSPQFPEQEYDRPRGLLLDELYSSLPSRDLEGRAARVAGEDRPG